MLFPECEPQNKLIGIARMAAGSPLIEAKRRVDYHELPTRKFVGRCSSERMPFDWTINPYRGCEFGCKYCYARYTHEFMELREPEQFEQQIFAKKWNEAGFREELKMIPRTAPIAIGTATDPYQPAERRYLLTQKMLAVLAGERGRAIWITTKSDLVARDAGLLQQIQQHNNVQVNMTITTMDEALARALEPYAPRPSLRIEAMRKLSAAGIPCGVLCCPLMPMINDSEASLSRVASEAAAAGARWMYGNVLFLKPCASRVFLPFVEERFPALARRYHERYDRSATLRGAYVEMVTGRVRQIREKHGLSQRANQYNPADFEEEQLTLF